MSDGTMDTDHCSIDAIAGAIVAVLVASTAAAQTSKHVEVAATVSRVLTDPVYLKPLATLGTGPATPVQVGRTLDVASPGIDAAVYVSSRVQGIIRWSRVPERTGDARLPPLPLPPSASGFAWLALVISTAEQRNREIVGAAVDVLSGPRVRIAAGMGLQVDHVTGTQGEGMLSSFHSVGGPTTPRVFAPQTLRAPVLLERIKIYPWEHLLVFVDAAIRVGSASGDRALYETSHITPAVGVGASF
jgi:hypothetical protein